MGQGEVDMYQEDGRGSRVVVMLEIEIFGISEKKPFPEEVVDMNGVQEIDWIGDRHLSVEIGPGHLCREISEIRGLRATIHQEKI